jgi:hypothetical protein
MSEKLIRIVSTNFCCGIVIDENYIVIEAAPILRWATGRHCREVKRYLERKGKFISWARVDLK